MMAGILEVTVDSLASARAAISGGANRLELCSALAVGGLTPYAELLAQIRAESDIPVRCLIRSRSGFSLYEGRAPDDDCSDRAAAQSRRGWIRHRLPGCRRRSGCSCHGTDADRRRCPYGQYRGVQLVPARVSARMLQTKQKQQKKGRRVIWL